ncbi:hypothetical protein K2173_010988 [Erythroxylum novogranatense]|uniref:Dirigent protein n=1 Tax=Erythroxylum novogranatense TaxID=1862640 RepID=A0AAV8T068_9ROSI|nr:hypothetical protein K2173_010988 [Erythroxylum novogranatense]
MARILLNLATQLMTISFLSSFSLILVTSEDRSYVRIVDKKELGLKKQKISHFRVYWHDILSGSNPTAVRIVPPPSNSSATSFGFLAMIDDPLTEGPNLTSKMVGRAQGLYGSAAQEELRLILAMNFVFTEGKFNGSSITILGSNKVSLNIREMPVIGGTGIFRLTRGYVQASTYYFNRSSGDTTVEYNIYVLHY